ncbi:MAG TPA: hypothetical protein DCL66_15945 [Gammaproteobacteria bacterium]|nr:hypothetical protein [Gammaproteobacteria bacterium]
MTKEPSSRAAQFATPVNVSESEIRPLARAQFTQFTQIQANVERAMIDTSDKVSRARLVELAERAKAILENTIGGIRAMTPEA